MKTTTLLVALAITGLGSQAAFASASYNFSTAGSSTCTATPTVSTDSCWGNSRTYSATETITGTAISVTARAYSNTTGDGSSGNADAALQTAYLGSYSGGFGVTNRDYAATTDGNSASDLDTNESAVPEHALDNNQRYDSIVLNFATAVKLSKVTLGYVSGDSDISVWAWMGSAAPTIAGSTYSSMLVSSSSLVTTGWVLVGNYADIGTTTATVNTTGISSAYWLIGAYNPAGTASSCSTSTSTAGDLDCGDDYVKLLGVNIADQASSSSSTPAPEPASLALVATALILTVRRRKLL